MRLLPYVLRRLALAILVLFGVTLITFYLSRGVPGISPLTPYITPQTPTSLYPAIIREHGLDQPVYLQYFYYIRDLLSGDWGYSRAVGLPVTQAIVEFFPATLELAIAALVIAVAFGFAFGILSALKNKRWPDYAGRVVSIESVSLPPFWLGLVLSIAAFDVGQAGFPTLPLGGRVDPTLLTTHPLSTITGMYTLDSLLTGNLPVFASSFLHLILPALTLSVFPMGLIARTVRASMLDVLSQDHVVFALSKGLGRWTLIYRHVVRNSLISVLTILGLVVATLFSGSVLVETVFAWPGLGQWAASSISWNDTAGIMGFTISVAAIFVLINLVVDVAYQFIDPRIRY